MQLYNSITNKKEEFKEIEKGKVKMYSCGPTVYNFIHIGNARAFIVFDLLRNYLIYRGYDVKFVQNFTDVDDKIINKAKEENVSAMEISEKYIKEYFKDADALGIKRADVHPKVTENINEIIEFIEDLIEKGYAYKLDNDVYFDVKKFKDYGKLSKKNIEDLIVGKRIEIDERKKSPVDFALWKGEKEGEISWDSPFGKGRPGWHIECSAMSNKYLGKTLDIHTGGEDLKFPHHENEIAQSECKNGCTFANYWVHNGYINVDNVKMSKSLGNFRTVREVLAMYSGDVIRFFMLLAHYRSPINYSKELLDSAKVSLDRIKNGKKKVNDLLLSGKLKDEPLSEDVKLKIQQCKSKFIEAMDDDINTADGISSIFELVKYINKNLNENSSKEDVILAKSCLDELTGVLNIAKLDSLDKLQEKNLLITKEEINNLIKERKEAKKNKDFKKADEIRDYLKSKNIEIKDTREGTVYTVIS